MCVKAACKHVDEIYHRSDGKVNDATVAYLCRVVAREVVAINLFNAFAITRVSGPENIATFVRTFDAYDNSENFVKYFGLCKRISAAQTDALKLNSVLRPFRLTRTESQTLF